jgi:hypothetical protein
MEYIFKVGLLCPYSQYGVNCSVGMAVKVTNHVGVDVPTGFSKLVDMIVMEEAINSINKKQLPHFHLASKVMCNVMFVSVDCIGPCTFV